MNTIINLKCIDQVLTFENTPRVASGGVKEDFIHVEFCSKWDDLTKTAVFWRARGEVYHVALDDNNSCCIPHEVLADEGTIYFGLFGVSSAGKQLTSEVKRYVIVKGAITESTKPSDPTPDIYTQLMGKYQHMVEIAEDVVARQAEHENEVAAQHVEHESAVAAQLTKHENEVAAKHVEHENAVAAILSAFGKDLEDLAARIEAGGSGDGGGSGDSEGSDSAGKIVTGSYVGTGASGSNNPNSITFEDVPKYVVIQAKSEWTDTTGTYHCTPVRASWIYGADHLASTYAGTVVGVTLTDSTLSWYSVSDESQLNEKNVEYFYFAIIGNASFDISTFSDESGSGGGGVEYNKPIAFTATLVASDWADNTQTITDSRLLADGYSYLVTPASDTLMDYATAFVYASDVVTDGKMVFNCTTAPSVDLAVNIVRMEVEEA